MRGPSSSHCAAAARIGLMVRDLMGGDVQDALIEFDPDGSLATTHESQGSDMGLLGGFLGWGVDDERLMDVRKGVREAGLRAEFRITPMAAGHPNTYKMTVGAGGERHTVTAISTGGGMIELIEIDGVNVSMRGDCHVTLMYVPSDGRRLLARVKETIPADEIRLSVGRDARFVMIKSQTALEREAISRLRDRFEIQSIRQISPVLPVLSRGNMEVPFITCAGMLEYNGDKDLDLGELAVHYECDRGAITPDQVMASMIDIVKITRGAIDAGLAGTNHADRILGRQSDKFRARMETRGLIDAGVLNTIILYTTAIMESKSAMGVIVAAPTAGACGGLPGACIGAAESMGLPDDDIARAMLAGGVIGVFISAHATFAAEVGGCQAECGAGSGMAAAALATLAGGSTRQAVNAASMALQNILGMICDPVAKRVEAPCLGKNVLAASNALACANMALSDYDPVIPLDEVVETMDQVGKMLPSALRCTGLGGLSITKTSREIEKQLRRNKERRAS
ncbi:MAG: serine dehydratase [Desulfobacterales bacterium]|nr:serine dehydratase [Desulfobacterales bacterium]